MKTNEHSNRPFCHVKFAAYLAIIPVLMLGAGNALATTTTYTFNPGAANNTAWSTTNWSTTGSAPYDGTWVNGTNDDPSLATFGFTANTTITLSSDNIVFGAGGGLTKQTGGILTINGGTGAHSNMNFTGATISNAEAATSVSLIFTGNINVDLSGATTTSTTVGRPVRFGGNVTVTGDFTAGVGGTQLAMTNAYQGTATIQGTASLNAFLTPFSNATSTASNFNVNSFGLLTMTHSSGSLTLGAVNVNSDGNFRLGATNSSGTPTTIVSQLSGNGGEITSAVAASNGSNNNQLALLVVDQTTNTTSNTRFRGVAGSTNKTYVRLTKQGTGNLTLTGRIDELQNVRVEGGGLWIDENNSALNRSFANAAGGNGSASLTIANGGTFGGDFPTLGRSLDIVGTGGRNIVVESGGRLSPGLVDGSGNATIGLLRIAFPDGGSVDLTAAVGNTGWLRFDLGANTTAGTTYDQINLTSGTLLIGTSLKFSDFNFTTSHAGFDQGVYTLFSLTGSAALSGSLNADQSLLSGIVGTSGLTGTLGLDGNDIILTVIPEPRASLLLLGAVVLWFVTRRRRMAC
jgi:hypothetical protein